MDTRETTIYHAVLIIAVIIGSIILYLIISLIRHHRSRLKMYQSKINTEITTLETERSRMAADLHDEVGPILSAAKFKLSVLHVNEDDIPLLQQVEHHIDSIITRMTDISKDLMPITLIRKGPVFAIQEYLYAIAPVAHLHIEFIAGFLPPIPETKSIHLYRIVQEVVHNTVKHSNATELIISLNHINDKIVFKSSDNGVGFDLNQVTRDKMGRGLQNILSRTEMLDGILYIDTGPGKGTMITVEASIDRIS